MPEKPSSRNFLIMIALILIALIPLAFIHSPDSLIENEPTESKVKRGHPGTPVDSLSQTSRTISRKSHQPPTHDPDDLKNFYLPPITFENVPLQDAIAIIKENYHQVCRDSGESPINFSFQLIGSAAPITYLKSNGDFISTCRLLAVLSATHFTIKENQITFSELNDGPVVARKFTIPPNFQHYLDSLLLEHGVDPFSTVPPITEILTSSGILSSDGSIQFLPAEGQLVVTSREKDIKRLDGLVSTATEARAVNTRLFFTDLGDEIIRASVIASPDIPGSVPTEILEQGREESYTDPVFFRITPHGLGEKINLYRDVVQDPFGGFEIPWFFPETESHFTLSADSSTFRSFTLQVPDSTGSLQERTLTLLRIDGAGRSIPTSSPPVLPEPLEETHGK